MEILIAIMNQIMISILFGGIQYLYTITTKNFHQFGLINILKQQGSVMINVIVKVSKVPNSIPSDNLRGIHYCLK